MAQVTFNEINGYNERLKDALTNETSFKLEDFPSVILLSAKNVEAELGKVINQSEGNILAVFGIDNNDKFTVSFLPLDKRNQVTTSTDGEENWPAASITNFPDGLNVYTP